MRHQPRPYIRIFTSGCSPRAFGFAASRAFAPVAGLRGGIDVILGWMYRIAPETYRGRRWRPMGSAFRVGTGDQLTVYSSLVSSCVFIRPGC
jgi:hypothetical protein